MITFAQPVAINPDTESHRVAGGATRKAVDWMLTLASERDISGISGADSFVLIEARCGDFRNCDPGTVSALIDRLKALPALAAESSALDAILARIPVCGKTGSSKYALPRRDGRGVVFFEVRQARGTKRRYINHLVGAPGGWSRQQMRQDWLLKAATKIATDPLTACKLYGSEFTVCGYCGSPLSDPDSIARQLGPVCAGKF
ncbi:MAG: DUF6011 domain-containing protein [Mycobacterium sp.]|nr:DUF6011 domain-containing protein [Mycobacterium sp.]